MEPNTSSNSNLVFAGIENYFPKVLLISQLIFAEEDYPFEVNYYFTNSQQEKSIDVESESLYIVFSGDISCGSDIFIDTHQVLTISSGQVSLSKGSQCLEIRKVTPLISDLSTYLEHNFLKVGSKKNLIGFSDFAINKLKDKNLENLLIQDLKEKYRSTLGYTSFPYYDVAAIPSHAPLIIHYKGRTSIETSNVEGSSNIFLKYYYSNPDREIQLTALVRNFIKVLSSNKVVYFPELKKEIKTENYEEVLSAINCLVRKGIISIHTKLDLSIKAIGK
jgi:hypothetical protein